MSNASILTDKIYCLLSLNWKWKCYFHSCERIQRTSSQRVNDEYFYAYKHCQHTAIKYTADWNAWVKTLPTSLNLLLCHLYWFSKEQCQRILCEKNSFKKSPWKKKHDRKNKKKIHGKLKPPLNFVNCHLWFFFRTQLLQSI